MGILCFSLKNDEYSREIVLPFCAWFCTLYAFCRTHFFVILFVLLDNID